MTAKLTLSQPLEQDGCGCWFTDRVLRLCPEHWQESCAAAPVLPPAELAALGEDMDTLFRQLREDEDKWCYAVPPGPERDAIQGSSRGKWVRFLRKRRDHT